jgi:phosphate transport system permease protein
VSTRRAPERILELGLLGCALVCVLITLAMVWVLVRGSAGFFAQVSPAEFLDGSQWHPLVPSPTWGVGALVVGTLLSSVIAIAVGLPLGLLAAIYLAEFASPRRRELLEPTLDTLAGIPTVVYGYFALVFVTPLLQRVVPGLAGFNALSPGIVMGLMIAPLIASLSTEALRAVPRRLREGAWALGAGEAQTIFTIVLPSAASGVAASVVLALSRALGETMIVSIAAGHRAVVTLDPREPIQTMSAYIVHTAELGEAAPELAASAAYAVGAGLFAITLATNFVARRLIRRFRETQR